MMRVSKFNLVQAATALAVALVAVLLQPSAAGAAERFAGLCPNSEGTAPVVWAKSKEAVIKKACEACRKNSETCADKPAWTSDLEEIFSLMCCSKPQKGCAVGVGATKKEALKSVQGTFDEAGYSKCKLIKYISPETGEELEED